MPDDISPRRSVVPDASSVLAERQRIERELSSERERLRITLGSIGDAVVSTDADGRVVFLNTVAEQLTGWRQADAVGQPLSDVFQIVTDTLRMPIENPALRALRERRVVELAHHTLLIARDGSERPIDDSAAPMLRDDGSAFGAVLVFRDVSERNQAQETQARLAAIVESSEDAILSKTLDGVIRSWNAGAERVFGYRADEMVGQNITLLIPPDRLDEEIRILARLQLGQHIEHFETVRVAKGGRRVDISLTVSPVKDADGRVIGASKIARDITARKRAHEALRASEELHRFLDDLAIATQSLTEPEQVMATTAQRLGEHLGVDRCAYADVEDESTLVIGSDYAHGVPSLAGRWPVASLGAECQRRLRQNERYVVDDVEADWRAAADLEAYSQSGMRAVICSPLHKSGKLAAVVAVQQRQARPWKPTEIELVRRVVGRCWEITERKRLERALRQRAAELAEADRNKDEFIALLAHELRNPLAPIRAGLDLLKLSGPGGHVLERARAMMDRQLTHMVRLIDDLLDVSRLGTNHLHLQKQPVALSDIVSHAVEVVGPALRAADHKLDISIPAQPVMFDADLTRLAQVFGNLLTNSVKYTPGGGRIWLEAAVSDGHAVVSIKDSGIGIPAAALPRVFEMFSRVDRSVERASGGLGIGLALVKGLIEAHGGTVSVESPGLGRGSTFTVRLPLLAENGSAATTPLPVEEVERVVTRRKVVVADDNVDGAEAMAALLEALGNEVHVAHDGVGAVELVERVRPGLVLMDVGMPRQDGLEATRQIRQQQWGRSMKIFALTGWGQDADRQRSRDAGCDGHLVKPVEAKQLEHLLRELPETSA